MDGKKARDVCVFSVIHNESLCMCNIQISCARAHYKTEKKRNAADDYRAVEIRADSSQLRRLPMLLALLPNITPTLSLHAAEASATEESLMPPPCSVEFITHKHAPTRFAPMLRKAIHSARFRPSVVNVFKVGSDSGRVPNCTDDHRILLCCSMAFLYFKEALKEETRSVA